LDRRALIIAASLPLGWAIGSGVWLLAAPAPGGDQLSVLSDRLVAIRIRHPVAPGRSDVLVAQAISAPLFALTTGPAAVAEILLKLEGLVRTPGRVAALLSINGGPSDWLELGQTRDGVTLQDVASSRVVVDTAMGLREVALGAPSAPTDPALPPASSFKSPPPPASAPGQPR
jgi:hypothetical protein